MSTHIEILVTATVPNDNTELGHDAMVASREPAQAIVDALAKLGLADARQRRRLSAKKGPRNGGAPVPVAAVAEEE